MDRKRLLNKEKGLQIALYRIVMVRRELSDLVIRVGVEKKPIAERI